MNTNSNDVIPPKWALCFLRSICPDHLYEEIEGDFIQKYKRDVKKFEERQARQKFCWSTLLFFRPSAKLSMGWRVLFLLEIVDYEGISTINF